MGVEAYSGHRQLNVGFFSSSRVEVWPTGMTAAPRARGWGRGPAILPSCRKPRVSRAFELNTTCYRRGVRRLPVFGEVDVVDGPEQHPSAAAAGRTPQHEQVMEPYFNFPSISKMDVSEVQAAQVRPLPMLHQLAPQSRFRHSSRVFQASRGS